MIKRRSKPRRVSVARDPKYLEFLRENGRCWAGPSWGYHASKIDPAHGPVNGMSSKGSDLEAIPLCRYHHDEMEKMRWPLFCEKYGLDRAAIAAFWNRKYKEMTE